MREATGTLPAPIASRARPGAGIAPADASTVTSEAAIAAAAGVSSATNSTRARSWALDETELDAGAMTCRPPVDVLAEPAQRAQQHAQRRALLTGHEGDPQRTLAVARASGAVSIAGAITR